MAFLPENTWKQNATSFDAWGRPKTFQDFSLFHGIWSHDLAREIWKIWDEYNTANIPTAWLTPDQVPDNIASIDGRLQVDSGATSGNISVIQSRRNPKYQPNRGHLYSTALGCPLPTAAGIREWGLGQSNGTDGSFDENGVFFRLKADGNLYAVIKSGGVEDENVISLPSGFDISKGNLYDIQFQWRGVGDYNFMVSNPTTKQLETVFTKSYVNTLDEELSIQRPALSAFYRCESTGDNVRIWAGCCDITSEGGGKQSRVYGSVSTPSVGVTQLAGETPLLAMRVNTEFEGVMNTRDSVLKRILASGNDESIVSVYVTNDASVTTGTAWTNYQGANNIQYSTGASITAALGSSNVSRILTTRVEQDIYAKIDNPAPEADFWLTPGDYVIITSDTAGTGDLCWSTIEFVQEI